jgi:hypothetical protein
MRSTPFLFQLRAARVLTHFFRRAVGLLFAGALLVLLAGCDTSALEEDRGRFDATFRGAQTADLSGDAYHQNRKGELLFDVFTSFNITLADADRENDLTVYITRRDTAVLTPGTYPLLDIVSEPALDTPSRVWAFITGRADGGRFRAYSRGGTVIIDADAEGVLRGSFQFPATALDDTTQAAVTLVQGAFESRRR